MSRTDIHVPYHVLEQRAMAAGFIDHEHLKLGNISPRFYVDQSKYEEVTFEANQIKEIEEFEQKLAELGDLVCYKKTENKNGRYYNFTLEPTPYVEYYTVNKSVTYEVTYRKKVEYTSYCTDAEHYENRHDNGYDTRDNKIAVCTPDVNGYRDAISINPNGGYSDGMPSRRGNTKRKAKLNQMKNAYNAGYGEEMVDSIFDTTPEIDKEYNSLDLYYCY